jgi:predicted nucleic acid-binding protein
MGEIALHSGDRFYFDTNVIVSTVEQSSIFGQPHFHFIERLDAREIEAVTSELSLAECLVKPLRDRAGDLVAAYLRFLDNRPSLPVLPIDRDVLLGAARIRATLETKLPDAIHIATAIRAECSIFLTNDKRLRVPAGLRVVLWENIGLP